MSLWLIHTLVLQELVCAAISLVVLYLFIKLIILKSALKHGLTTPEIPQILPTAKLTCQSRNPRGAYSN